jgi:hypothetical protein
VNLETLAVGITAGSRGSIGEKRPVTRDNNNNNKIIIIIIIITRNLSAITQHFNFPQNTEN